MPTRNKRIALTVVLLVGMAAMILGAFVAMHMKKDYSAFHGTLLKNPRAVQHFSLKSSDGAPFNNKSLEGQWTMMFFGFTNCGYLCPTTMAELAKMHQQLEEQGSKRLPQVVMVSIDPKRDSAEKLNQYVKAFNPKFVGARGDETQIKAMTKELGVAYMKVAANPSDNDSNYDVDHTGTVMLFNPKGELQAFFTTPHQAHLLVEDYLLLTS